MDYHIDIVYQNPVPGTVALHMPGPVALGLETVNHAVRYCLDLTVGRAAADHEVVGGRIELAEIDDDYIFGFLLQCEPATLARKRLRC